ncbi:beta-galactosidase GalA [Sphingomonas sp. DT-51]|uniref:beta-galactosidase GalA n=1 Tax=Sphingomonas sp. DT-51 TaxID=3396165 RepID=UPI003F1B3CF7
MHRRDLLRGTAALAAVAGAPLAAFPAAGRAGGDGLPMPAPTDILPPATFVGDPTRTRLEQGWLFHEGDIVSPVLDTHNATYLSVKAGNAQGAAAIDYDDSDWQRVRVPHDWAAAQPFVETANVAQGYRPRGIGWYRRHFALDAADRGKRLELHFDGIATNATIWVNGSVVAHHWSGYTSVYVDLTPFARFGDELNIVAIRVDANAMEGWWYEGAGLYRHAWLVRRPPVSIASDGIHCDPRRGDDGAWHVPVAVTLTSVADGDRALSVAALLLDPNGREVARAATEAHVTALDETEARLTLAPATPALWSVERPTLYTVVVRISDEGIADERRVRVGFRSARFDAEQGFFLNDRPVKLKGVCLHQDHAGVGVAMPDALHRWRLERLKAIGCNAIRCSHNAPAAEFLDLCDELGFVVMDENRQFNPAPDYMAQLRWLVRRDRNHPSVILWSVFNEEPMQGTPAGVEMVRRMAHAVRALDDSRPVTAAMNGAFFEPASVSSVVDVTGFNYYQGDYDRFHRLFPTRAMTSSEDTSAFETRGAFASDPSRHILSSYDDEAASWGDTHRKTWRAIAERRFVAGGFTWTGFDYHGEPTPYAWPTVSSFFGIMDLCGFPKTAYDVHRAHWVDDAAVVAIAPHWTWPGREGQAIRVLVMSNAEEVTLSLNGRSLGTQRVDRIMGNEWQVPYAPGRLEAVARRAGRTVAHAAHETAGAPVALRLTPARRTMLGDGEDAQPVTVDAIDARGRHVPIANLPVTFAVRGAEIIGLGNGDPNSHEPEKGNARRLFNGLAQVIVRTLAGDGAVTLTATSQGLRAARTSVARRGITPPANWPEQRRAQPLAEWRRSPALRARPAADAAPPDGDNNSWAFVRAGALVGAEAGGRWRAWRAVVRPWRHVGAEGGVIRFDRVVGRAELRVDGRAIATKRDAAAGPIEARVPPGAGERIVLLLVEGDDTPAGIAGKVTLAAE